tara:strand:- start:793 stop:1722 length:930 start_codon:yes stop_codon:yes gene_type:complete
MTSITTNNSSHNIRRRSLEQKIKYETLLLDGATGTELERRGVDISLPLWSARAILDAPEVLMQIHLDYLLAGADIITTNTFRTHRHNLALSGIGGQAKSMTQQAVAIAQKAVRLSNNTSAFVAGSIAPLGDSYQPSNTLSENILEEEHGLMSNILVSSGVDLILVETMNTIVEAEIATRAAISTGCPTFISLVCDRDGSLLSGESLSAATTLLLPLEPHAILLNCTSATDVLSTLQKLRQYTCLPIGVYANVGYLNEDKNWIQTKAVEPDYYAKCALRWNEAGATLIGGCCGTRPDHIATLRNVFPCKN